MWLAPEFRKDRQATYRDFISDRGDGRYGMNRSSLPRRVVKMHSQIVIKTDSLSNDIVHIQTIGRVGLTRTQARVETEQGSAVQAEDRLFVAHIEVDVRVVVRW